MKPDLEQDYFAYKLFRLIGVVLCFTLATIGGCTVATSYANQMKAVEYIRNGYVERTYGSCTVPMWAKPDTVLHCPLDDAKK